MWSSSSALARSIVHSASGAKRLFRLAVVATLSGS